MGTQTRTTQYGRVFPRLLALVVVSAACFLLFTVPTWKALEALLNGEEISSELLATGKELAQAKHELRKIHGKTPMAVGNPDVAAKLKAELESKNSAIENLEKRLTAIQKQVETVAKSQDALDISLARDGSLNTAYKVLVLLANVLGALVPLGIGISVAVSWTKRNRSDSEACSSSVEGITGETFMQLTPNSWGKGSFVVSAEDANAPGEPVVQFVCSNCGYQKLVPRSALPTGAHLARGRCPTCKSDTEFRIPA